MTKIQEILTPVLQQFVYTSFSTTTTAITVLTRIRISVPRLRSVQTIMQPYISRWQ